MPLQDINLAPYMTSPFEIAAQQAIQAPLAMQRIRAGQLANQMAAVRAQSLPQQLQARQTLLGAQATMAGLQAQAYPEQQQAKMALLQAQTGALPAQIKGKADLLAAQTALAQERTKMLPQQVAVLIKHQAAVQQRFRGAYKVRQMLSQMTPAGKATWIANNQAEYDDTLAQLGTGALLFAHQTVQHLRNKIAAAALPQTPVVPSPVGSAPVAAPPLGIAAPDVTPAPVPAPVAPTTIPGFKVPTSATVALDRRANEMAANQYLTTTATRQQREGGAQIEELFNSPVYNEGLQATSQFAGLVGKGKATFEALSQQNHPLYEKYLSFRRVMIPLLLNRIRRLDSMGLTDTQNAVLHNMYEKAADTPTSNPVQFVEQMGLLQKNMTAMYRAVTASATPLFPTKRVLPSSQQVVQKTKTAVPPPSIFPEKGTAADKMNYISKLTTAQAQKLLAEEGAK